MGGGRLWGSRAEGGGGKGRGTDKGVSAAFHSIGIGSIAAEYSTGLGHCTSEYRMWILGFKSIRDSEDLQKLSPCSSLLGPKRFRTASMA
jgi:hypothetical protein